jgi:hypothetical protein
MVTGENISVVSCRKVPFTLIDPNLPGLNEFYKKGCQEKPRPRLEVEKICVSLRVKVPVIAAAVVIRPMLSLNAEVNHIKHLRESSKFQVRLFKAEVRAV